MERRVIIDRDIPYIKGVFEPFATVEYLKGDEILSKNVENATVMIVRTRTKCDERLLANSAVKLIVTATIGTDHIDMEWCRANNIAVESAQGCNSRGVLQWVTASLVVMAKRLEWGGSYRDKIIGVVGVGNVGSLVAEFAQAWGFNVLKCDPHRAIDEKLTIEDGFVEFETILKRCDLVTFHTPLCRSGEFPTYHMLNMKSVRLLSKGAVVLNSSRGEVVESRALIYHIARGGHCCIDTWESEPKIDTELLRLIDIATPHIAGYSRQGKATATAMSVRLVAEYLSIPINNWFPSEVQKNRAKTTPLWSDVCSSIGKYCDVEGETILLKAEYSHFEELRSNYIYREEYF